MFSLISLIRKPVSLGHFANRVYFSGGVCTSKNQLDGKNVIITGGNTGLGYETGLDLAKRGFETIIKIL